MRVKGADPDGVGAPRAVRPAIIAVAIRRRIEPIAVKSWPAFLDTSKAGMLPPAEMAATKNRSAPGCLLLVGLMVWFLGAGCTPGGVKALREGQQALAADDLSRALARLEQAVARLPTNAVAWNEYGVACHRAGRLTNAAMAYVRALQLNPDLLEARYNLGCLYLEAGQFESARSAFLACTLRDPGRIEAWWRLGLASLQLRQTSEAERAFREMQKLAPTDPRPWNGLGLCALQRNRVQEAVRAFTAALQVRSNDPVARLNLAVTLHRYAQNPAAALEQYRQYLALQPPPPDYAEVLEVAHALEQSLAAAAARQPLQPAVPTNVTRAQAESEPPESRPGTVSEPARAQPWAGAGGPPGTGTAAAGGQAATGRERTRTSPVAGTQPEQERAVARKESQPGRPGAETPPTPGPGASGGQPGRTEPVAREVVRLPPATPVVPAPPPTAPSTPATPAGEPRPTTSEPVVEVVGPAQNAGRETVQRGPAHWWERLNPTRWLRSTEERTPRPTPLPDTAGPVASGTVAEAARVAESASAARPSTDSARGPQVAVPARSDRTQAGPAPATGAIPRYTYLRPARPQPGDANTGNAWFAKGLEAQRDDRLMDALQAYQMALEANPAFFEAYYNFALAALRVGRLRDALRASEFALALRPDSRDARYNFALALRQGGYLLDAAEELETLLRRHPNDTRAWLALGNLYAQQLNRPDRARECYERLLALEPGHPDAEAIRYWLAEHPR